MKVKLTGDKEGLRHKYHPPFLVRKIFNDFIWETTNGKILLTFDDGPTESATPKILEYSSIQ